MTGRLNANQKKTIIVKKLHTHILVLPLSPVDQKHHINNINVSGVARCARNKNVFFTENCKCQRITS